MLFYPVIAMIYFTCAFNVGAIKSGSIDNGDPGEIPSPEKDMDYEQYANIVKNGLHKTTEPKSIVITGAGMAGLSAAYVLKQAGHKVCNIKMI